LPGCSVHILLATRVLSRWRGGRSAAPFPIADVSCLEAFYAGCVGPDFGYYPGCDLVFAELAHYLRAADLVRALVGAARDDRCRAFAWGWVTHVLADIWIHPLVNRGVGRKVATGESLGLSYAEDPVNHIRVELGLDAYYAQSDEVPERLELAFHLDPRGINFVADAYDETYRIRADRRRLLASYRNASRLLPLMLKYERAVAPAMRRGVESCVLRPRLGLVPMTTRTLSWLLPRGCAAYGLLRPYPPPAWLVEEVDLVLDTFVDKYLVHYSMGIGDLPQYNLDTGVDEGDPPAYPLAVVALHRLERLRGDRRPGKPNSQERA
jgi:hypothetical protein